MSVKELMIKNVSRFDLIAIEKLIVKYNMYNVSITLPVDAINDDTLRLVVRYGLNVHIAVACIEIGHDSIAEIAKRNPEFLDALKAIPAGKLTFVRKSTNVPGIDSVLALALNNPNKVIVLRNTSLSGNVFYSEYESYGKYNESLLGDGLKEISNIEFVESLEDRFDFLDYGLLKNIGIIGVEQCLLLTK